MHRLSCIISSSIVIAIMVPLRTFGAITFNPADVLVSTNNEIREYTPTGTLIQSIPVPWPNGTRNSTERTRDLTVMSSGKVAVYNGTFTPYVSILDPITGTWQHMNYPGWTAANSNRFVGITSFGPYVYVTDERTFGNGGLDEAQGIVQFDTRDGSGVRFETTYGTRNVNIGIDGLLYAVGDGGDPTHTVKVYNPTTLALIRTITLPDSSNPNDIVANAAGHLYAAENSGITEYGPTGQQVRFINMNVNTNDLDLAPNGRVVIGAILNGVFSTNESFTSFTNFPALQGPYVAFPFSVPEPTSIVCLTTGVTFLLRRPRRAQRTNVMKPSRPIAARPEAVERGLAGRAAHRHTRGR